MEEKDIQSELSSIRNLMERSTRFISLSGLAGVLAGVYALVGTYTAYRIMEGSSIDLFNPLLMLAIAVLTLSVLTGIGMTVRQAQKMKEKVWNPISRKLIANMALPLLTGGLFVLILLSKEQYDFIAAFTLIFYGLALAAAGQFTFSDVKWLGLLEIVLGLIAALLPEYSLWLWGAGFGVLHILYGTIMHVKYKQ